MNERTMATLVSVNRPPKPGPEHQLTSHGPAIQ